MSRAHYCGFDGRYAVKQGSMGLLIAAMDQTVPKVCVDCGVEYRGARPQKRCKVCQPAAEKRLAAKNNAKQKLRNSKKEKR